MRNKKKKINPVWRTIRATIINLIVAFVITSTFLLILKICFGQGIDSIFSLLNTVSIDTATKQVADTIIDNNKIKNYPEYGTQYATIQIPKIGVDLPVYYGDTLDVLKNGVGHSSGSYFPGEGGTIIYMGHNSKNVFRRFSELQKGNEITIKTSYGEYKYKIYDMQLINETDLDKLPIQQDKEILMIYTCYPFNNIGYTTQRYVVYAELEK